MIEMNLCAMRGAGWAVRGLRVAALWRGPAARRARAYAMAQGAAVPSVCPGCGVRLQADDPHKPGYYVVPKHRKAMMDEDTHEEGNVGEIDDSPAEGQASQQEKPMLKPQGDGERETPRVIQAVKDEERSMTDEAFDQMAGSRGGKGDFRKEWAAPRDFNPDNPSDLPIVCQRCYALQHYGRVKSEQAEELLPSFDFERVVGKRIEQSTWSRKPVIVVVLDAFDVEGSFPVSAVSCLEAFATSKVEIMAALTKADLLPSSMPEARLKEWLVERFWQRGFSSVTRSDVHIVSGVRGHGMKSLTKGIEERCGLKGEAWFVGSQNAGKSSLIKCLSEYYKRGSSKKAPSVSHQPGTTLGPVQVKELLPGRRAVVDTPGLLQSHQISARLPGEEAKLILPRKPPMPRTFRVPEGTSIHLGALARVDVDKCPSRTIYLTAWVSESVMTHMGKVENAEAVFERHAGSKLRPPCSRERVDELGKWQGGTIPVDGESWSYNSVDIAIAGLGWVSVRCSGRAWLTVWTGEGADVRVRRALVWDVARDFEKPGFSDEQKGKRKELKGPKRKPPPSPTAKPKPQKHRHSRPRTNPNRPSRRP